MSTHMPGPWYVSHETRGRIIIRASNHKTGSNFTALCQVMAGAVGDDQAYANARLIAAAPELLAACQDILEGLELRGLLDGWVHDPGIVDRLRAAITRAEGKED